MKAGAVFLSVREVAERTGYSREHAYRLCREGIIPSTKLANGRIVVPVKAFDDWIDGLNEDASTSALVRRAVVS